MFECAGGAASSATGGECHQGAGVGPRKEPARRLPHCKVKQASPLCSIQITPPAKDAIFLKGSIHPSLTLVSCCRAIRRGVVRLQACLRCHVAVRRAAKLRQEAQEQKRLEDKVLRLQRKLEDVGPHPFLIMRVDRFHVLRG